MPWTNDNGSEALAAAEEALKQALRAEVAADSTIEVIAEAEQVTLDNKTKYLPSVATVALRNSTYPNPSNGDTVKVTGDSSMYRFQTGTGWVKTDEYNPTAIDNVTAILAEKAKQTDLLLKADKSLVDSNYSALDTKINSQASGAPSGIYATVTDLQAAFPTGNAKIYLITTGATAGHWYYWNGLGAWVDGGVYQSTGLAIGSVTGDKTTFMQLGKNLFNKATVTAGKYVVSTDGTIQTSASYSVSDFTPILSNTQYTITFGHQVAFYDANKVFISGLNGTGNSPYTFTTPANAVYARYNVTPALLDTYQFEIGNAATPYESYGYYFALTQVQDKTISASKLAFAVPSLNLLNQATVNDNYYVDSATGALASNTSYATSDYIPVTANTIYSASHNRQLAFYGATKVYISGINDNPTVKPKSFTTPANASFVRISIIKTTTPVNQFMVALGSVLPQYEPFGIYLDASQIKVKQSDIVNNVENITLAGLDVIIPRKVYILKGDVTNKEQLNLYFKNLILANSTYDYKNLIVDVNATYGRQYDGFWRMESITTGYTVPSAPFVLTVNVMDKALNVLLTKTCTIELVDKTATTAVRHLAIGDSITRDGSYLKQFTKVSNFVTQGTRFYDSEADTVNREGRGGWTLSQYVSAIGDVNGNDSPFVFPIGVAGTAYKGNTAFWKKVGYTDPNGYDYLGFQKIAKGWSGSTLLYNANGYLITPTIGEVMVDPSLAVGSKWIEWNGSAWVAMATQPTTFEVNFAKYLQRFSVAFSDGAPTHISILLGANDFQTTTGVTNINTFIANLNTLIASIRAYSSTIKVIINLPTLGANQDAWGIQLGSGGTQENYDRNMKLEAQRLLTEFDTDAALANNIYVCPMGIVLDTVYGFDFVTENANIYSTVQVNRYSNWVHPNATVGHKQMGDALVALVQKIR